MSALAVGLNGVDSDSNVLVRNFIERLRPMKMPAQATLNFVFAARLPTVKGKKFIQRIGKRGRLSVIQGSAKSAMCAATSFCKR